MQELELNGMEKRSAIHAKPVTAEYELTAYGNTHSSLLSM
ncbi:winged helix-turn-helix transcriptional regulator [Mucilaginibacter polytrichastri]